MSEKSSGFFVDWDGNTRRVENPGAGFECVVVTRGHVGVDVLSADGAVVHEATFFATLDDVRAAGVEVHLVEEFAPEAIVAHPGESFRIGETWLSPKGYFWLVTGYDHKPGTGKQAVLRLGKEGAGRKALRKWDAVDGWTICPAGGGHGEQ